MPNFQTCIFIGHLTSDPELRQAQSGTAIAKGRIACNRGFGEKKRVAYIPFTVFGKRAEGFAEHHSKGDAVLIQGEFETSEWEADGEKRSRLELIVDDWSFMKGKDQSAPPVKEAMPF